MKNKERGSNIEPVAEKDVFANLSDAMREFKLPAFAGAAPLAGVQLVRYALLPVDPTLLIAGVLRHEIMKRMDGDISVGAVENIYRALIAGARGDKAWFGFDPGHEIFDDLPKTLTHAPGCGEKGGAA